MMLVIRPKMLYYISIQTNLIDLIWASSSLKMIYVIYSQNNKYYRKEEGKVLYNELKESKK